MIAPPTDRSADGSSPEGVVWDLGNVLIDWDPLPAIEAGVGPVAARAFLDDVDFRAWNHGPDSGSSWDDAEAWLASSHPQHAAAGHSYRVNFAASLLGEEPGSADLVRALHAAGVPQWGLTNWSAELYPHAPERFDVLALLDDVIVSGVEGLAKPDPAIFALLASRTGRRLDTLAFVDDRADNVAAGAAAGLDAILFTGAVALAGEFRARGLPV